MNEIRPSVTQSLIIINVVVFGLGLVVRQPSLMGLPIPGVANTESFAMVLGSYSWFTCFIQGELWRLISYQFVHANLQHILFNMVGLYYFGPLVERAMGEKPYLLFYLCCGVAGALFSSLLAALGLYSSLPNSPAVFADVNYIASLTGFEGTVAPWQMIPIVGASAAIYGIIIATAFMYPHAPVTLLIPPVTMRLRTFALGIIGIATATILFNWNNAGGEAGHLGGAIMGTIIMLVWKYRLEHRF